MDRAIRGSLKIDIASAYLLSGARMGAWLVVAAVVYRRGRTGSFATMALLRSTVGLLSYFGLGLAPAVIHLAARRRDLLTLPALAAPEREPDRTLGYADVATSRRRPLVYASPEHRTFTNATAVAVAMGIAAAVALAIYVSHLWQIHRKPEAWTWAADQAQQFALWFGIGVILRVISDSAGAILQVRGRITLDNVLQGLAEIAWAVMAAWQFEDSPRWHGMSVIGGAYAVSGMALLCARLAATGLALEGAGFSPSLVNVRVVRLLLSFGSLVALAQLADFLYAPMDYVLINRLLNTEVLTAYAPAVQVDAALLLSVTALAAVLLPHAAILHGRGDLIAVRRYYVRGTFASLALLIAGATAAWLLAPWAFRLWLHDAMPATQAILPLVLVHTVVGGSSAVGRSILLAVGKVKAFTVAVLVAGVTNVVLSYVFVRCFHLGLRGIVLGTIVAVVGRCALWMPWYVVRTLRRGDVRPEDGVEVAPAGPEVA